MDQGEERVEDEAERRLARQQAAGVMARGVLIGAGLTAVVMLV
jgi:hypothetical protein